MFTFQHIYEATFAAKTRRQAIFATFENILDFWIMAMGMIYITIVYKVYRYNTFIRNPTREVEIELFFTQWNRSTDKIDDHIFLLIIDLTYLVKGLIQLRFIPAIG